MFAGEIGQQIYAQEMAVAVPGLIIGMGQYAAMPYMNTASGVQAVYTVTPPGTVDANTTYRLTIDGIEVSFTTGGATTAAQLGQGLYNAIRANAEVFRKVEAAVNGSTGVVTLTARFYNVAVPIASPSNATTTNDLTIANTVAPGTSVEIPFGRFVGRNSSDTVDAATGIGPGRLVNAASGFRDIGITMKAFLEKNARGPKADTLYPFQSTMNVLTDCVGIQGIWMDCVETDIVSTDTLYCAVGAGNEGKASKTSSSNLDLSSRGRFITSVQTAPNGKPMVGVYLRR